MRPLLYYYVVVGKLVVTKFSNPTGAMFLGERAAGGQEPGGSVS